MTHMRQTMPQSKIGSLAEAGTNIIVGYVVTVAAQHLIFPFYGIELRTTQYLSMGLVFVLISLARTYVIRRVYNKYSLFGRGE